jgi:hypothetical protein
LPDDSAAKSHYIRVIDNEGEDYLDPADYFLCIEVLQEAAPALLQASCVECKGLQPTAILLHSDDRSRRVRMTDRVWSVEALLTIPEVCLHGF